MEKEELVKLLKLLELDKTFVRMLKDECGYYLVYEYSDEEVPFKRCIANYCQNDKNLEKIFILDKFVCNGKKGCKVGCLPKDCSYVNSDEWSISKPCKCACWYFDEEIDDVLNYKTILTIKKIKEIFQ